MDSVDYARQAALGLTVPQSVAVVGCGGVGSWAAQFLAMAGVPEIWLFDGDTISSHNLNRLPVPPGAIDQSKSGAIADMIRGLRPDCRTLAMGNLIPEVAVMIEGLQEVEWVVCTTDTLASRRMIAVWARAINALYVEAAAEGEQGSATGAPAEWATEQEALPGYASVPVWVGPCVMAAAVAVAHVLHNQPMEDRAIRVGWNQEQGGMEWYDSQAEEIEEEESDGTA